MLELTSPDFRRNPFPAYQQLREPTPILHDPASDAWFVLDYDSVRLVLSDVEHFSSDMRHAGRGNPDWIIFMDPPRQPKLRGLISRAFSPRSVAELEPSIQVLADRLIDQAAECGEMDVVGEFATPLAMQVIAGMLGIPVEDWPLYRRWSDVILNLSHTLWRGAASDAAIAQYGLAKIEMCDYFQRVIEQRRVSPQEDLLTRLVAAESDGQRLSEDEIIAFVELLLVAGQETTSNLISNAVLCFHESPRAFPVASRESSAETWSEVLEEVLRFRSPVQWVFRASTSPL